MSSPLFQVGSSLKVTTFSLISKSFQEIHTITKFNLLDDSVNNIRRNIRIIVCAFKCNIFNFICTWTRSMVDTMSVLMVCPSARPPLHHFAPVSYRVQVQVLHVHYLFIVDHLSLFVRWFRGLFINTTTTISQSERGWVRLRFMMMGF